MNETTAEHSHVYNMQQQIRKNLSSMDMGGSVNEATVEYSIVQTLQLPCKSTHSRDMEGSVNEATVEHPIVQTVQLHCKTFHPMGMEGPVNEATAEHSSAPS